MGQDPRAGGTQVTDQGTREADQGTREPHEIQRDIETTRGELGDTVEALAEKADVKTQAQRKVAEVKRSVDAKREQLVGRARQASPDGAGSAASTVSRKARENPVPVAVAGAFALGVLFGRRSGRRS